MLEFWESLAFTTKFSAISAILSFVVGLFSMGFLGIGLYYAVSFLFSSYPSIKKWHGDWTWTALIGSGMAWGFGFVIGGVVWHLLSPAITSTVILCLIYLLVLWLWAAFIWYMILRANRFRFI